MIGIVVKKRYAHRSGIVVDERGQEWHYVDTTRDPDANKVGTIVNFSDHDGNVAGRVYQTDDILDYEEQELMWAHNDWYMHEYGVALYK